MPIHYEPDRQGMTVLPPDFDDATGEIIEGSEEVVDTRFRHFAEQERAEAEMDDYEELPPEDEDFEGDYLNPEEEAEALAEVAHEINNTDYTVDPYMADAIAQIDMSDSPEAITVQYLTSQVFAGNITPDDAFREAIESGLDVQTMMANYYYLQEQLSG